MDRVSELAAAVGPEHIAAVQRVESLDAMPLLWAIDDALLALDRLPAIAAQPGHERRQARRQERRPENERDDGGGGRARRRRDARGAGARSRIG